MGEISTGSFVDPLFLIEFFGDDETEDSKICVHRNLSSIRACASDLEKSDLLKNTENTHTCEEVEWFVN
jgi:hypothetical protein